MKLIPLILVGSLLAGCAGQKVTPPTSNPIIPSLVCQNQPLSGSQRGDLFCVNYPGTNSTGMPAYYYGDIPGITFGSAVYWTSGPGFTTRRYNIGNQLEACAKANAVAIVAAANSLIGALITNYSKWSSSPYAPQLSTMIYNYNQYWKPLGGFTTAMAGLDFLVAAAAFLGPAQLALLATAVVGGAAVIYIIIDCTANGKGGA